jgi:hypothetical protein
LCCEVFVFFLIEDEVREEDYSRPGPVDNFDKVSDKKLQPSESFHCTSVTRVTNKACHYNESYLSMGFTWAGRYISVQSQV